jgi:hypothetical protein
MTWVKTGAEFPDDCANVGLSDAAYRTHHEAITWLYTVERMDMLIPKRLAGRVMFSSSAPAAVTELVAHGWWKDVGEAWELRHHADVVRASIATQQNKRSRDKKAQAAARARASQKAGRVSDDVSADADSQSDRQTAPRDGDQNAWVDVDVREPPA